MGLLILSPLFLIVTCGLWFVNAGKPFFFQVRPGKGGELFKIIKFKTMTDKKDSAGNLLPDVRRITTIGKMIRLTSIDELPQLINVLKGDMSLVGPRPLLVKYMSLYSDTQLRRHDVRPGITGLAQVNGRNSISWTEKFKYDVEYVDNMSLSLDIQIMYKTVLKVIKKDGVNQSDARPMEPFNGYN